MSDNRKRYFIDTNVWLYAFIVGEEGRKTVQAKEVIESGKFIHISTQVINETCINLMRKAQFSETEIQRLIKSFYTKYRVVSLDLSITLKASELRSTYSFSFWDSLIVASALSAKADVLYTEDMQNGMLVEQQLRIVNPFEPY